MVRHGPGDAAAFDAVASEYDATFSDTALGQMLRERVWEVLARHFVSGQRVIELACGTGEDSLWLAKHNIRVIATDGSVEMLRIVNRKARAAGQDGQIETRQLTLQALAKLSNGGNGAFDFAATGDTPFDGVLSNFGGLNTISEWRSLAESLSRLVRVGGRLVLVPMGPFCPWEILWHLIHGEPRRALRRFGRHPQARVGETTIPVWYPSAGRLRRDLSPWFQCLETSSLGLWLPPTYLGHRLQRFPRLFDGLARLERISARLSKGWGDHYIMVFTRMDHDRP